MTNTCGSGLESDGHVFQVKREGDTYTVGFEGGGFTPAIVTGNNLHATLSGAGGGGTHQITYDLTFDEDGQSFHGTIDVAIQTPLEGNCALRERVVGNR